MNADDNPTAPDQSPSAASTGRSTSPPAIPDHELVRRIGQGASGEVWLACNVTRQYRAIKVVYRHNFQHQKTFDREFHGIQKFEPISRDHEGFVDILHVGRNDADGFFYCVMELADNELTCEDLNPTTYRPKTLTSELAHHQRLPVEQCVQIGLALTDALDHLHRQDLVHRDIKLSNIIFVHSQPKLADIGLVTDAGQRSYVGTEGYIPPEGPGRKAADIYSLGKVLYEISTGKDRLDFPDLPTDVEEDANLEQRLQLNRVILKACSNDPAKRYQSAGEMRADLRRLEEGKPVKSRSWLTWLRGLNISVSVTVRIAAVVAVALALAFGISYRRHLFSVASRLVNFFAPSEQPTESPTLVGAKATQSSGNSQDATSLNLPHGCQLYVYGFVTGGAIDTAGFTSGIQEQVRNAYGRVAAGLAVTTNNENFLATGTAWHSIGGFGASSFRYVKALYAENNSPGAPSASVRFTLGAPALVAVLALGGAHQYLDLHGPPELQQDAAVPQHGDKPLFIAHAYLGAGDYEISESTSTAGAQAEAAATQDPNNMADLLGVFIFSDQPSPATSSNPQIPVPSFESGDVAQPSSPLSVASPYSDFSAPTIQTSNMSILPGAGFAYNTRFGKSWLITTLGGSFTGTFTVPSDGQYDLVVTHLTSYEPSCPGNGYSPVTIQVNSAPVTTDYDPAANHGGTHGMVTDRWPIVAHAGQNTLQWSERTGCTHYWIQRIEISVSPQRPIARSSAPSDLNKSLIAYYPFDGNANDASGNGHDATLMNSPSFVNGVRGSAVYLKGSGEFGTDGQYVQLPFIRLADSPSFTVALWAKIDGVTIPGSHETIIGFGTGTCGPPNAGRIAIDYSAGTPTELTFESGGPNAYVLVRPIPSGCWGNWAHYTLVYDSGELKAFVNGRLVATKAGLTAGQTGTDAGLGITRWNTAGCPYGVSTRFIGAVSELRIYNRALSPNEIAQLAKSGKTALNEAPTAPPLPPPAAIAPPLPAVLGGADHRG